MHQKPSASEKYQFLANQTERGATNYCHGKEYHLEPRGGASFYLKPWCIIGMPAFLESPDNNQVSGMKLKSFN